MTKLPLTLLAILGLASFAFAEDTKLEGQATCAKCDLKTADKCQAVLQVKTADGKMETYYTEAGPKAKELHGAICKGGKPATVEGTVSEKDGKKMIAVTNFEVK